MRLSFVVDASVAVKWFVREEHSDEARELAESGAQLIAPRFICLEVAGALAKKARRKLIQLSHLEDYLSALPTFFDELIDDEDLVRSAISLAVELDHPLYDCLYIEAAKRRQAIAVTSDLRLLGKVKLGRYRNEVIALSDWKAALA